MAIYIYTDQLGDYTLLRGPCDEGFHVPLKEEWQAIIGTGLTNSDYTAHFKLPRAGYRDKYYGDWLGSGNDCDLRSSSVDGSYAVRFALISDRQPSCYNYGRGYGFNIRAFRNTPIVPDETWTETLSGKVWYNSDLGLISVLVGTNQYITMQDKNVGATEVYNGTINSNNRGKYFQRGNNHPFSWGNTSTSSTLVDASGYGPNNPYSSSTFITTPSGTNDRSSVKNDNLRGYTDFNS